MGPTALTIMAFVLAVVVSRVFSNAVLAYIALALLLVASVRLLLTYARWANTSFVVTTDRLVYTICTAPFVSRACEKAAKPLPEEPRRSHVVGGGGRKGAN